MSFITQSGDGGASAGVLGDAFAEAHPKDTAAHAASAVTVTPTTEMPELNVQAALAANAVKIDAVSYPTATQAEMRAGVELELRAMSPELIAEAIGSLAGVQTSIGVWEYEETVTSPVTASRFRRDNVNDTLITTVWIAEEDANSLNFLTVFQRMDVGDTITIGCASSPGELVLTLTAVGIDQGAYFEFPVAFTPGSSTLLWPPELDPCDITLKHIIGGSGSSVIPLHAASHNPGGLDAMAVDAAAGTGSLRTLGTAATAACAGNDARLSNARTPTSHVHGNISNAGAVGTTANLPLITGASGVVAAGAFGTGANTFCQGDDTRLSNARTPIAHASTHNAGGGDALAIDAAAATGSLRTLGTGATAACAGNDSRLSNARTPTAHAASHNAGGADALAIDAAAATGSLRTLGTAATAACAGNDARLSNTRTPTAHASTHNAGGADAMAIDAVAGTGSLRTLGTAATAACAGNDSRLSDARTPTSHVHGNITNAGAVGATANLPLMTGTAGAVVAGAFGSAVNTVCQGNDARLSDARTPSAHAASHNAGGADALAIDAAAATGSLRTLGTAATAACAGNDSRLSNTRTPTAHASTHNAGGADAMAIDAAAGTGSLRTLGTGATAACSGNDARLSDARTPTSHVHGNITNAGAIGANANLPVMTGTSGVLTTGAFGTAVNTFCQGNDSRLSNARTPTAHAASHAAGQADMLTPSDIGAQIAMATATQAEMEAGTVADLRAMTPLTVRQGGDARLVAPPQIGSVTPNMGMFTALRLHNTTDTTVNFERLAITWSSNAAIIGTNYGGTGVSRSFQLMQGGAIRLEFTPTQLNHRIPSSSMLVNYGTEQLTAGGWTAGTGWAEAPTGTFTHSSGTATLAHSVAITSGDRYHCSWTVTGRTAGSFVVAYGGYLSTNQTASGAMGHVAVDTATLVITPTTDFNGVVTFSLKRVSGGSYAGISWQDSSAVYVNALSFPGGGLSRNIVMGGGGAFITSGDWNTGIGTSSLTNLVTGKTNSAFGAGALTALESGNGNIAAGGWSLGSLLNGTSNVGIGGNAGRFLTNLTTAATKLTNSIFIGSNASSLAIDSTNQIVIGSGAQGLGTNTTVIGNSTITKTRLQGTVETNNDFESITAGKGVLLRSPNGTRYRIAVSDAGVVTATAAP